jgi:ADP-ribosylglycohydrolase
MLTISSRCKARGALVGLGVGDALGAPVELQSRAQIYQTYGGPLTEVYGQTTDDTAQAICLAKAIAPDYDSQQAIDGYVDWFVKDGYGIGGNSKYVLGQARAGHDSVQAARDFLLQKPNRPPSNGALMRCVPLGLRYRGDIQTMNQAACLDASLTHAHPLCAASVGWFLQTLVAFLDINPVGLHNPGVSAEAWEETLAAADFPQWQVEQWAAERRGMTLVPVAMSAYAIRLDMSVEEAMVWAVNCGGDTDTNAALVGAMIAGRCGIDAVPQRWQESLSSRDELILTADRLWDAGS